jgi:cytochrome c
VALLVLAGFSSCRSGDEAATCEDPTIDVGNTYGPAFDAGSAPAFKILLYTYSTGFRHDSIPTGIAAILALGAANGFGVDVKGTALNPRGAYCANRPEPADVAYFRAETISSYAAVVFLQTTTLQTPASALLDDAGKAAFEAYVRGGGGFVGIHAAADAEYAWPFYHEVLGATFLDHGPAVESLLRIEDAAHPAVSAIPNPWLRYDEWYNFTQNPRVAAHVLINLDEATYPGNPSPMGDHPIAWCKVIGEGRSFYTGLGHARDAFSDALVLQHLLGGILYAGGKIAADCSLR